MKIDKSSICDALCRLVNHIRLLPEIERICVRDVAIFKEDSDESLNSQVHAMIEACYHDCLSDVDVSVEVRLPSDDHTIMTEYMSRIDRFGFDEENVLGIVFVEESRMYRIILKNGMRYDFGFSFICDDGALQVHFERQEPAVENPHWTLSQINRFWFIQIQALAKLYRKDYLVADHLANMNINETLVQQMILRDIEHGTNYHRYGYQEALCYQKYLDVPFTTDTGEDAYDIIARKLRSAALTYDELVTAFYPDYQARSQIFFDIWRCYHKGIQ